MPRALRDRYGVPSILGINNGETMPIQATPDGKLCVSVEGSVGGGGTTVISANYEYKLVKTIRLDLGNTRNKEVTNIDFDCLVIPDIQGVVSVTVDSHDMTINKCMSVDITAEQLQISNKQQVGYCEIWFFKKERLVK